MYKIYYLYFLVQLCIDISFFFCYYQYGDVMKQDFIVTGIKRVILVGKNEYPQSKTTFTNPLGSNEIIYHFSGKSTVHFNGKILDVEENTIRFLPKGENKEYVVERRECGECIDIFFDTDLPLSDEAFVIKISENTTIANLFKKLFTIWVSKNDGYYFECISLLYKIFAQMQKQNYIPQNQYEIIKPAIDYIEKNFQSGKIPVTFLAEKCGISEAYLKKLFIRKFGVPPVKYIIQLKINHACDLLRSERYSITQVAEFCGYDNVYFFSRQFKEYVGASPSVFVERYKSSK